MSNVERVIDLGFKPHEFQRVARSSMTRFSVLVCHRRWGKTVFAVMELILRAMSGRSSFRGAYICPYRKQAKDVAWDYFKRFAGSIPGIVFNETELLVVFPGGQKITLYGADNAEALRGLYMDFCVMDEVADMKPTVWGQIIRPTLSDRKGWALFIGTPKGMNLFFELYNRGVTGKDGWSAHVFRASETVNRIPWLDDEELAALTSEMKPAEYRQEMECDFNASSDNTLISLDTIYGARGRFVADDDYKDSPLVFGVDVARFGDDASVIQMRRGKAAFPCEMFRQVNNMELASIVNSRIQREKPSVVFIDAGQGQGVIDRLRDLRPPCAIIEVAFGGKARNSNLHGFANRRAEMWDSMRAWMESGGSIPDDYELCRELAAPMYSYDGNDRLKLERKEEIRERCGFSPDRADALALTFAEPISGFFENGDGIVQFGDDAFSW